MSRPAWSGVIEGFYGRPWTQAQRFELLDRLGAAGLNAYVYCPKDDLEHRARWRDPYDDAALERLGRVVGRAAAREVRFVYGIAPGLDVRYGEPDEVERLAAKLRQLLDLGCRDVAILFDDIRGELAPADRRRFGSLAAAQAHVTCEVWGRLDAERLLFCPTEYCGNMAGDVAGSAYLRELGRALPAEADVFWTGPDIVSERIEPAGVQELAEVLGRPPVIWDNLFANDYDVRRVHLGPFAGRPLALRDHVRGILLNPNCEHPANAVALETFARYLAAEGEWDPRAAYLDALRGWLPAWRTHGPAIDEDDLRAFGDCFYLPGQSGPDAAAWWADLVHLLEQPPAAWGPAEERFEAAAQRLTEFQEKVTALADRELLHAVYRPLWELKEELLVLQDVVRWRRAAPAGASYRDWRTRAPIYRGALVTRLRGLLTRAPDGGLTVTRRAAAPGGEGS